MIIQYHLATDLDSDWRHPTSQLEARRQRSRTWQRRGGVSGQYQVKYFIGQLFSHVEICKVAHHFDSGLEAAGLSTRRQS